MQMYMYMYVLYRCENICKYNCERKQFVSLQSVDNIDKKVIQLIHKVFGKNSRLNIEYFLTVYFDLFALKKNSGQNC